jgi:hypothetical protein
VSRAPGTTRVSVQLTHAQARQLVRAAGLVVGTGAGDVRDVRCLAAGAAAIERAFVRQEEKRAERERRRAAGVPAPELKAGARR